MASSSQTKLKQKRFVEWFSVMAVVAIGIGVATYLDILAVFTIGAALAILLLLALNSPMLALGFYVASIPFEAAVLFTGPVGTISKGTGVVFALAYLAHKRGRIRFNVLPAWGWLWVAWALASTLWAAEKSPGAIFTLVQLFVVTLLIADVVSEDRSVIKPLLWVFSGSAGVVAILAVSRFTAITQPADAGRTSAFDALTVAHLAALMVIPLLFGVSRIVASRSTGDAAGVRLWERIAALGIVPLAAAAVLVSGTRSAWLAAILGLAVLAVRVDVLRLRSRVGIVAMVAITVGLSIALWLGVLPGLEGLVTERAETAIGTGGSGRTDIWQVGIEIVKEHPVVGVGFGSFPVAYDIDAIRRAAIQSSSSISPVPGRAPHSIYLSIGAELGLVGIVLWIGFLWWLLFAPGSRRVPPAVYASFSALLVVGLFLDILNRKYFWLMIAFVLAARASSLSTLGESAWPPSIATPGFTASHNRLGRIDVDSARRSLGPPGPNR